MLRHFAGQRFSTVARKQVFAESTINGERYLEQNIHVVLLGGRD